MAITADAVLLEAVRAQPVPAHVAIIMDGNGRWATQRGLPRVAGHREGVKAARAIVRAADAAGLRYLTLYAFSTENWNRPEDEVTMLMRLLEESIYRELPDLMENRVRLRVIGPQRYDAGERGFGLLVALLSEVEPTEVVKRGRVVGLQLERLL